MLQIPLRISVMLVLLPLLAFVATPTDGAEHPSVEHPSDQHRNTKRPNVILIISDDQAWNDYGFMGHQIIQTPNLDRLARESAVFPFGYVPSSLCRPSLMTLATGLYPHQHGVTGNDPPRDVDRQQMLKHIDSLKTLPQRLVDHGYLTLQTGKWWEGNPQDYGFTHAMTHGDPARGGRHGDEGLKIGRQGLAPIEDFLDHCGDRPFFVWYAPFLPHTPHNPPARFLDRYRSVDRSVHVARYYAMCEWFDETCGQLTGLLRERDLSEQTLVIYITDNGWIQRPDAPRYAPRSKRSPNEGGVRTPIMLHWPGQIPPVVNSQSVSSVDLVPTIMEACEVPLDSSLPGRSLLSPSVSRLPMVDRPVYGEILEHDVVDIDDPQQSLQYRWMIDGEWKLILPYGSENPQLYQLRHDPFETRDLASSRSERVAEMSAAIERWWPLRATAN